MNRFMGSQAQNNLRIKFSIFIKARKKNVLTIKSNK